MKAFYDWYVVKPTCSVLFVHNVTLRTSRTRAASPLRSPLREFSAQGCAIACSKASHVKPTNDAVASSNRYGMSGFK